MSIETETKETNDSGRGTSPEESEAAPRKRGFGAMSAEKQREIARKGGQAAHAKGRAHQFAKDEAREAGRKGGHAVSKNREHMAAIGRAGGLARGRRRAERAARASQASGEDKEGVPAVA
jgi:general stress protein YciG